MNSIVRRGIQKVRRAFQSLNLESHRLSDGSRLVTVRRQTTATALLFCFTGDAVSALSKDSTAFIPRALRSRGVLAASLDVPCHGMDCRPGEPERLAGWRFRFDNGESLMADFTRRGSDAVDLLIAAKAISEGATVCVLGISRGAFAALHFAAADQRVRYLILMQPLVNLKRLPEFLDLDPLNPLPIPISRIRAAEAWIGVRDQDEIIHTADALALADSLRSAGVNVHSTVVPGVEHNVGVVCHQLAGDWLDARLTKFK